MPKVFCSSSAWETMRAMYSSLVYIFTILAFLMLLPLQGARLIALIPRVVPWARCFCPFRACGGHGIWSTAAQTLRNQSSNPSATPVSWCSLWTCLSVLPAAISHSDDGWHLWHLFSKTFSHVGGQEKFSRKVSRPPTWERFQEKPVTGVTLSLGSKSHSCILNKSLRHPKQVSYGS